MDILGYLKNTHKNPKFGRVRQVPIRERGWEFPGWDLSHFVKFGIFMGILKYPKISKNGNPLFFPVNLAKAQPTAALVASRFRIEFLSSELRNYKAMLVHDFELFTFCLRTKNSTVIEKKKRTLHYRLIMLKIDLRSHASGDNEEHFIGAWGKGKSCLSFLRVLFLPVPALHHNARNFEEEAFFHLLKV